jgi:beta-N-acetylhexosaminidase
MGPSSERGDIHERVLCAASLDEVVCETKECHRFMANVACRMGWGLILLCVIFLPHAAAETGTHLFISIGGTALSAADAALIREVRPGGVVLLGGNVRDAAQTRALVRQIKEAAGQGNGSGEGPLIAVDQEGGRINRLRLADAPSAGELGATGDTARARAMGLSYARACREQGIEVVFAPVLDIRETGAHGIIGDRAFGYDAATVTAMGLAFAQGLAEGGAIAVGKHYPGHGGARQDSHTHLPTLDKSAQEMAVSLYPFERAAVWGIPGMMTGHLAVPALDPTAPGRPASLSPVIIQTRLRSALGYEGVILTDDIGMGAITQGKAEATVQALAAGNDMVICFGSASETRAAAAAVESAVNAGRLDAGGLVVSRERIDRWRSWLRMNAIPVRMAAPTLEEERAAAAARLGTTATPMPMPTPASAPLAVAPPPAVSTHTVVQGDTLYSIGQRHGIPLQDIQRWNNLDGSNIRLGQVLLLAPEAIP